MKKKMMIIMLMTIITITLFGATKAYMGVVLGEMSKEDYREYQIKEPFGILIESVAKKSPAEEAGIEQGDVLMRLDDNKIYTIDQLQKILSLKNPKDKVALQIFRDNKLKKITLELGEIDDPTIVAYLGVVLSRSEDKEYNVKVSEVIAQSPAEKVGILPDDIIVEFDDEKVFTQNQFKKMLNLKQPRDKVRIKVKRGDEYQLFKVELDEKKNVFYGKFFDDFKWSAKVPENVFIYKYDNQNWIGITIDINKEVIQKKKLFSGKMEEEVNLSITIKDVKSDSPAEKAGLIEGDIIYEIDGEEIKTGSDLRNAINEKKAGEQIVLSILRDDKKIKKNVTIESAKNRDRYGITVDDGEVKIEIDGEEQEILNIDKIKRAIKKGLQESEVDLNDAKKEIDELKIEIKEMKNDFKTKVDQVL